MLPYITFMGRTIAMYGLMVLIGVLAATCVAVYLGKGIIKTEDIIFSILFGTIGVIIGAKVLYLTIEAPWIIAHWDDLMNNKELFMHLLTGGFIFYGGLIGGLLMVFIYCKKYHIPIFKLISIITPAIPLAHAFGRLGCLFAGCCYGIHYEGFGHIIFHNSPVAPNNIPLFPTQLSESILNFIVFIILFIYAKKRKGSKNTLALYLVLYSIMRFFMEFVRGDLIRGIYFGLSTSQWISILLLGFALWLFFQKPKNAS
ncbi:MAG TPA: prolipoprotein diacylglyceryl transferase [Clostridiales bacterium]|nr:prolipoprotein diacylglyceryl transferase [Clostridiales bacterium]